MTQNWTNRYSPRVRELIRDGIGKGKTDQRIASLLNVSVVYVEAYRKQNGQISSTTLRQPQDAPEAD